MRRGAGLQEASFIEDDVRVDVVASPVVQQCSGPVHGRTLLVATGYSTRTRVPSSCGQVFSCHAPRFWNPDPCFSPRCRKKLKSKQPSVHHVSVMNFHRQNTQCSVLVLSTPYSILHTVQRTACSMTCRLFQSSTSSPSPPRPPLLSRSQRKTRQKS